MLSSPADCCCAARGVSYASEFGAIRARAGMLDFEHACEAAHGLSVLITGERGGEQRTVLFDAGPTPGVWRRNVSRIGADLSRVGACVLSHWHSDHSGGLAAAVPDITAARGGRGVVVDVHPDRPHARGLRLAGGVVEVADNPTLAALHAAGGELRQERDAHTLLDDFFFVSGEIPRLTEFERGLPPHVRRDAPGAEWTADPLIMDERYLAVFVRGRGPLVLSACSHAGVVNVATDAAAGAGVVFGLMGGFHLAGPSVEPIIGRTADALRALCGAGSAHSDAVLLPGHCTGWRAKAALLAAFPGMVQPSVVGGCYTFSAREGGDEPAVKRARFSAGGPA